MKAVLCPACGRPSQGGRCAVCRYRAPRDYRVATYGGGVAAHFPISRVDAGTVSGATPSQTIAGISLAAGQTLLVWTLSVCENGTFALPASCTWGAHALTRVDEAGNGTDVDAFHFYRALTAETATLTITNNDANAAHITGIASIFDHTATGFHDTPNDPVIESFGDTNVSYNIDEASAQPTNYANEYNLVYVATTNQVTPATVPTAGTYTSTDLTTGRSVATVGAVVKYRIVEAYRFIPAANTTYHVKHTTQAASLLWLVHGFCVRPES